MCVCVCVLRQISLTSKLRLLRACAGSATLSTVAPPFLKKPFFGSFPSS